MEVLTIDKEVKIRSVKKIWGEIDASALPLRIDFKNLEKLDCAGFQLLLYLLKLGKEKPDEYTISGIQDNLIESLTSNGYIFKKGEHNK